ncbi:ATP-binding protein [Marinimicrobium agarilyticum]|uniref:ATP-binding protein n=1 Tax=Marinimicrobium agarilyticum TaxID=306546 RepID=UPI00040A1453|nr:ATP-binding protein [Marinimicrobium agarilyticum]
MTEQTLKVTRPRRVAFPWLSGLAGVGLALYLLAAGDPALLKELGLIPAGYQMHPWLQTQETKVAALLLYCLIILWEVFRHSRRLRAFDRDIERLRTEVNQVWQSKKQLQLKAHTFAGHADKLKLFISEKLLEYIEYDEKFLHFKSIAAEVRHNGVICFDKVQTALEAHLEQGGDEDTRARDQDAYTAMRYLWDLLDLSTTDNIALHIGNHLCECEEHYYQQLLSEEASEAVPHRPDYPPRRATLRALAPLLQDSPTRLETLDSSNDGAVILDEDPQFRAHLNPTDTLLGNENHFVLLLENLLKNAQFFARKKAKSRYNRVALTLGQQRGRVEMTVYNRGPHIEPEAMEQIFQLGYSTRRAKEHHGKGLGLFFVQEIVKGYEGRIWVENVENRAAYYSLRIALASGGLTTEVIEVMLDEQGHPYCRRADSEPGTSGEPSLEWDFDEPITRVELTPTASQNTLALEVDPKGEKETLLDPDHAAIPRWALKIQPRRKGGKLIFTPLDVAGVCFHVQLPTAASRLDGEEEDLDALAPREEELNRPFEGLEDYRGS